MATESTVFASNVAATPLSSEAVSNFNPNRNTKSVLFEDVSIASVHENTSENKVSSLLFAVTKKNGESFQNIETFSVASSSEVNDIRKLIAKFLYPFHFFW